MSEQKNLLILCLPMANWLAISKNQQQCCPSNCHQTSSSWSSRNDCDAYDLGQRHGVSLFQTFFEDSSITALDFKTCHDQYRGRPLSLHSFSFCGRKELGRVGSICYDTCSCSSFSFGISAPVRFTLQIMIGCYWLSSIHLHGFESRVTEECTVHSHGPGLPGRSGSSMTHTSATGSRCFHDQNLCSTHKTLPPCTP